MASKLVLSLSVPENPIKTGDKRQNLRRIANQLIKTASGQSVPAVTMDARASCTAASGTITMASSSGTVGAVINGVTITVTWATSDTNSAALLAAAINASSNALIQNLVTATSALGVTTITAVVPGKTGNCITLVASGTNVTASGARLTGGAETRVAF